MYTRAQHTYVCGANVFYQVLFLPLDCVLLFPSCQGTSKGTCAVSLCTQYVYTHILTCTHKQFSFSLGSPLYRVKLRGRELWEATPSGLTWGLNPVNLTHALCATLKGYFFTTNLLSWEK